MKINHGRVAGASSLREGENFTGGDVWVDLVLDEVADVMTYNVFFIPRARTNWHRHSGGQILVVTGGSGWVATRTRGRAPLRAGDVVWSAPGEEHWHGADEGSFLVHTAVSLGTPTWLEPVTDDEYAAAAGDGTPAAQAA